MTMAGVFSEPIIGPCMLLICMSSVSILVSMVIGYWNQKIQNLLVCLAASGLLVSLIGLLIGAVVRMVILLNLVNGGNV